jgi:hypothetical protein
MTAREFCARFATALEVCEWGDIDPYLFDEIAETEDASDLSGDAALLLECVERALS